MFSISCSKENSGVCTPITVNPLSRYLVSHARTYGSVRSQLTHVNVQNCTSTTFPRRFEAAIGPELSHLVPPLNDGRFPSDPSGEIPGPLDCALAQPTPRPAAASPIAPASIS